jgi:dolichyl-phosphate-mannose--protein O-mannosyl transferase
MHIVGILLIIAIWVVNVHDVLFMARYSNKPVTKLLFILALQVYTAAEILMLLMGVNLWAPFIVAAAFFAAVFITYIKVSPALYGEPAPEDEWAVEPWKPNQNEKTES